ncbi:DUF3471 domain-containing protein [Fibrella arboris]|uniref:DUF3471 domain-containing protein n=1 Tax=Fibrella arboris TaxID=3242486 RepID=UPI0035223142
MVARFMLTSSLVVIAFLSAQAQSTGGQATTPVNATATSTTDLREYAGTYTFTSGSPISTYSISVKEGNLYGDAGMGEYKLLKQEQADQYKSTSSYGSIITFIRDATTKAVTGLTLAAQGQALSATKEK